MPERQFMLETEMSEAEARKELAMENALEWLQEMFEDDR
jgi:hypothetical protein